jgi:PKD repeat protein
MRPIRRVLMCSGLVAPILFGACGSYTSDYPVVVGNGNVHAVKVFADGADMGTVGVGQTASFTLRLSDLGYNNADITGNPTSPTSASAVTFSAADLTTGTVACFQQTGSAQTCKPTIVTHLTTYVRFEQKDFCPQSAGGCEPQLLVAEFVMSPSPAASGSAVAFNGAASHAATNRTLVRYTWNFGDPAKPQAANGVTATHTYDTAGTYNVTLTVADDAGQQATVSHSLVVR